MKLYFDNATTTFPKPKEVCDAVYFVLKNLGGTSGRGFHKMTYDIERIMYEARKSLAVFFNVSESKNIIFTYNATYALNIAIKGYLCKGDHVVTTTMEHNSVTRPLLSLQNKGVITVSFAKADSNGFVTPDAIELLIKKNTRLIVLSHVSNVCGTIQPVKEIGIVAKKHEVAFLLDASQSSGYIPVDVSLNNISMLAASGHKGLLGPQGTGILYVSDDIKLDPLIEGGTGSGSELDFQPKFMPDFLQSGTVNTPGVSGLLEGIRFINKVGLKEIREKSLSILKCLHEELMTVHNIKIHGTGDLSLKTCVLSFTIDKMMPSDIAKKLEEDFGVVTRAGIHCSPFSHKSLETFPDGTVRLSPGYYNTINDTKYVISAIKEIAGD